MTPYVVTSPVELPVSFAMAQAQCRLDIDLEEDLVTRLIWSAYKLASHYQQRTLLTTTYEMKLGGFPLAIPLPMPPFQSVEFIKYIAPNGDELMLDSSQYEVDLSTPQGIVYPAYGCSWPSVRCQRNAVTVRWVAGSETVTVNTQSAILLIVAHLFEHRESVSETTFHEVPMAAKALLDIDCWSFYA
jgi:uncharacterized phiE125 gp8 family phage protein